MSQLDDLKSAIKSRLGELECVIGWGAGYDPLHATPLFIRSEADLDRLVIGPLSYFRPKLLDVFHGYNRERFMADRRQIGRASCRERV